MQPGDICRHERFYRNPETGELEPKYLLCLARTPAGDFVARLLTSRAHGRPEQPPCYHGYPYPGFYLGVPGGPLGARTWLDLRHLEDLDEFEFASKERQGILTRVLSLDHKLLVPAIECAAGAEDTTRYQEQALRDELDRLRA